jgi:hypothetical protein
MGREPLALPRWQALIRPPSWREIGFSLVGIQDAPHGRGRRVHPGWASSQAGCMIGRGH